MPIEALGFFFIYTVLTVHSAAPQTALCAETRTRNVFLWSFSDRRMSRNEMKLQQRAYMVALRDLVDTGRYDTRYIQSFYKNTQSVQGKEEG